jgi:pimeloyl-ACP methyl ester carboxylesterase
MRVLSLTISLMTLIGGTANAQVNTGYAPVNGIRMYYEIHGEGQTPVVLIHGGGSTIETSFHYLLPLLAEHRRVVAVELQAHGRTSDRDGPESFQQDADDVAALLKYLQVGKADFLGFSNGGSTVLQIAIRHPDLVNKIVPKLLVMFRKDKQRMIDFKDWGDDDLRSIKAPAMIISSDRDVIMPEHSVRMARMIPGARLVILPGVHGSTIGTLEAGGGKGYVEVVARLVEEFLKE